MFLSHGRHLFTGSQTVLEECRREWDLLSGISLRISRNGEHQMHKAILKIKIHFCVLSHIS